MLEQTSFSRGSEVNPGECKALVTGSLHDLQLVCWRDWGWSLAFATCNILTVCSDRQQFWGFRFIDYMATVVVIALRRRLRCISIFSQFFKLCSRNTYVKSLLSVSPLSLCHGGTTQPMPLLIETYHMASSERSV